MVAKPFLALVLGALPSLAAPVVLIDYDDGIPGNGIHDSDIRNGGFEGAAANQPLSAAAPWTSYFAESDSTPAILDTSPRTGNRRAIASGWQGSGNRVHPSQTFPAETWTIQAGDVFNLKLWVKPGAGFDVGVDQAQAIIHVVDQAGNPVSDTANGEAQADRVLSRDFPVTDANAWKELSATSTPVPAGSPWIGKQIRFRILNLGDRSEFLAVDDVYFTAERTTITEPPAPAHIDTDVIDPTATAGITATPNIVLIYADDLGFGDISIQGATAVRTPHIDSLATHGIRFTDAHSAAPTCTPSRYSLLTGSYAWRTPGTGVAAGNAGLLIEPGSPTLPAALKQAGYSTGVVGKWHLGLGTTPTDFTQALKPGPLEIGFDSFFGLPATADRVPCVYVENHGIHRLNPAITNVTPLRVSYGSKIGTDPTQEEIPAAQRNTSPLLRPLAPYVVPGYLTYQTPDTSHNKTIVAGVSRIGYMTGAENARWADEDIAGKLVEKASTFIQEKANGDKPFFLYFATNDIHVPRVPHSRFVGTSSHGMRGDAIHQLDWQVGEILARLADPNNDGDTSDSISDNTLVIFSSDNGPVLNDGYADGSGANPGNHDINGPYKGGKYSVDEGGHRVPFLARWPGVIAPGTISTALISQTDLFATLATLTGQSLPVDAAPDSQNILPALLGRSPRGRSVLINQDSAPRAFRWGTYKHFLSGALYQLATDPGETSNIRPANAALASRTRAAYDRVAAEPKTSTLAAWWPFDEGSGHTLRDLSLLRHNASLTGDPAWHPGGGKPFIRFNGIDQKAEATEIPSPPGDFTLSIWARSAGENWNASTSLVSRPGQFALKVTAATRRIAFVVHSPGGEPRTLEFDLAGIPGLNLSEWRHFAASYQPATGVAELFVDGIKRAVATFPAGTLPATGTPVRIGSDGTSFFAGDLSDIRLYHVRLPGQRIANAASARLLDADEDGLLDDWELLHGLDSYDPATGSEDPDFDGIDNLREFQAGSHPLIPDENAEPKLLGHWKFDEPSGATAHDSSGDGRDGTLIASPSWTTAGGRSFLSFNGTANAVEIHPFPDNSGGVTVSAWARSDTATWNIAGSLVSRRAQWALHPWTGTTRLSFLIVRADTEAEIFVDFDFSLLPGFDIREWHHYAATYDAGTGTVRLFLDGKLHRTATFAPVPFKSQTTPLFIGKDSIQTRHFAGDIDEVIVYQRALPAAAIAAFAAGFDDDEDGIPDEIERLIIDSAPADHLVKLTDILPDDDFDSDGQSNLSEAIAGTDPASAADYLKILSSAINADTPPPTFSATVEARPGRIYELEQSADLQPPWIKTATAGPFDEPRTIALGQPHLPGDKAFYRIRVRKAP